MPCHASYTTQPCVKLEFSSVAAVYAALRDVTIKTVCAVLPGATTLHTILRKNRTHHTQTRFCGSAD